MLSISSGTYNNLLDKNRLAFVIYGFIFISILRRRTGQGEATNVEGRIKREYTHTYISRTTLRSRDDGLEIVAISKRAAATSVRTYVDLSTWNQETREKNLDKLHHRANQSVIIIGQHSLSTYVKKKKKRMSV